MGQGYNLAEGQTATVNSIKALIAVERGSDLKWVPKLKESNIAEKGKGNRMKVSTATKLLSKHTAVALKRAVEVGVEMPPDTLSTADLVKKFNDW